MKKQMLIKGPDLPNQDRDWAVGIFIALYTLVTIVASAAWLNGTIVSFRQIAPAIAVLISGAIALFTKEEFLDSLI